AARKVLRRLRGANGAKDHATGCAVRDHYRAPQRPGDPFGKIPRPRNPFDTKWEPLQIEGPTRALVIGDVHFPFYDRAALLAAMRAARDARVKLILLNGDIID